MSNPADSHLQHPETPAATPLRPLRLGRTLRFAFRTSWDSLGFVCASSLTLFAALCLPLSILGLFPGRVVAFALSVVAFLALIPALYGGICWLAHKVNEHDEPSYADVWSGFRSLYGRSLVLGAIQLLVTTVLAANILFYLSRPSPALFILAIAFAYFLLFWLMSAMYHWPLLIATHAGVIRREDNGTPGMMSVIRNGFVLALTAPGYTFIMLLVCLGLALPLAATGVGLALLAPGLVSFLTTQAARDQLVRFNLLPEPPDPDETIEEGRWTIQ